jgi:ABC-type multidrug transport system ATPase subunit
MAVMFSGPGLVQVPMQIEFSRVSKFFGPKEAVSDASFTIPSRSIVALSGPWSAGKTTILKLAAGLYAPTSGSVLYDEVPLRKDLIKLRQQLCFLSSSPVFFPQFSLTRHLAMILRAWHRIGTACEEKVFYLLQETDLLPLYKSRVSELTHHQVYLASFIALAAIDPQVWLLDEPFSTGQDEKGTALIHRQLKGALARGRTVIFSVDENDPLPGYATHLLSVRRGYVGPLLSISATPPQSAPLPLNHFLEQLRAR